MRRYCRYCGLACEGIASSRDAGCKYLSCFGCAQFREAKTILQKPTIKRLIHQRTEDDIDWRKEGEVTTAAHEGRGFTFYWTLETLYVCIHV
jgi:hypothetical protein